MEFQRSFFCLLPLLLCLRVCNGALNVCTANITESINNTNQSTVVLLYTRVEAPDNASCMHFVWQTKGHISTGYPTLFVSQTGNDSKVCSRDCSDFINSTSKSVDIPGAVDSYFSIAVVFTRLIEFLVDNTAAQGINGFNATYGCGCVSEAGMNDLDCENYTSLYLNDSTVQWDYDSKKQVFSAGFIDPESGNATSTHLNITIQFPTSGDPSRLSYFPKTLFTANSSTIDIVITDFVYNLSNVSDINAINASRLALETFIVHGPKTRNGSVQSVQSLDDEYTPSMFTTTTYSIPDLDSLNGFLQWKPISYQTGERRSTASQQANVFYTSGYDACDTESSPEGLASLLFGDNASNVTHWFIVFGTPGDQTYFNSKYLSWTSVIGFGNVPEDQISFVVIITIIVGLGVPAALVFVGAIYVFIKKKPWQNVHRLISKVNNRGGYTKLN